jgi:prepilin-type N-terminal cleavage/methylation domain-containing protein
MMKKNGFTLTEVMITLAIIAVLAGLAVPGYFRTVESSRANEALTNLNIIHMGQKIYRINNGTFWNGGANATPGAIYTALNVDIAPVYYTDIDFTGVSAAGYTCTVTRNTVQGGAGTRWYQFVWDETNRVLDNDNFGGTF